MKYSLVSKNDLNHVTTPFPTRTWQPISHTRVVGHVDGYLEYLGIGVKRESFTLNAKGDQLFSTYQLDISLNGAQIQLGFRNSNNKRFAMGFCGGIFVLVCSNMDFSGDEFVEMRKHTSGLTEDVLEAFIQSAVDKAVGNALDHYKWQGMLNRIPMDDKDLKIFAHDAMTDGAIQPSHFNRYQECLDEEIDISDDVTLYQPYAAVTRMHRETPVHRMPAYSKALKTTCNRFQYWI